MGNDRNEPYLWRERWGCVTAVWRCDEPVRRHSIGALLRAGCGASFHYEAFRDRGSAIAVLRRWERVGKMEPVASAALTRAHFCLTGAGDTLHRHNFLNDSYLVKQHFPPRAGLCCRGIAVWLQPQPVLS